MWKNERWNDPTQSRKQLNQVSWALAVGTAVGPASHLDFYETHASRWNLKESGAGSLVPPWQRAALESSSKDEWEQHFKIPLSKATLVHISNSKAVGPSPF